MTDAILYESLPSGIARIVLNRADTRNAQDTAFLYALNDAFDRAAQDEAVKVIILAANGPHFSSGHDLMEPDRVERFAAHRRVDTYDRIKGPGAEQTLVREKEIYFGFSERWRNIPKVTIAQVQGKCIAGGLMLAWPCDLIVASDDAQFQDNTLLMGVAGVEYLAHPWEIGVRKAKEWLFTSEWLGAEEARALGMVNRVVPRERLEAECLGLARTIAEKSHFTLALGKLALNAAEDAQGRRAAMETAFAYHQLAHAHNKLLFGKNIDPSFMEKTFRPAKTV